MSRRPDWPERLAAAIAAAGRLEGNYYCATFAADCVLAMTDVDYADGYRHLSRRAAAVKLRRAGYHRFYDYLVATFGEPVPLSLAQRGDLVVRTVEDLAVGICCGRQTAFTSSDGLVLHPTLEQRWCFAVGERSSAT